MEICSVYKIIDKNYANISSKCNKVFLYNKELKHVDVYDAQLN